MLKALEARRWGYGAAAHLLNRAGFGGTPGEIEALEQRGLEGAVDGLLEFADRTERREAPGWAKPDPERARKFRAMRDATEEERRKLRQEEQQQARQRVQELRGRWLERMVTTKRPLEEKLVLFWHGHFATSVQKVRSPGMMYGQLETFREHAVGHWPTFLKAVTRDPAMLVWLDQAQSRRERPNENYAREVLELFTLGEGHYTEADIREAARAFTGLGLDRPTEQAQWRPRQHDDTEKTFLGKRGRLGPDDIIDQIVAQPQAGRFLAARLWRFFASAEPSPELTAALADVFRRSGNRIRPVLRAMFRSEEFYADDVVRTQIKSPVPWLVMALRQLERPMPRVEVALNALRELGQELLAPPNVKGWDGGVAWINTGTLTRRQQFAALLVLGREGLSAMAEGERARRLRERLRTRGRAERGADAGASGPVAVERLFSESELGDRKRLITALGRRFLQARPRPALVEEVEEVLGDDAKPDPRAVLDAVRVVVQSTDYQVS